MQDPTAESGAAADDDDRHRPSPLRRCCRFCRWEFATLRELRLHLATSSDCSRALRSYKEEGETFATTYEDDHYPCRYCNRPHSSLRSLWDHLSAVHQKEAEAEARNRCVPLRGRVVDRLVLEIWCQFLTQGLLHDVSPEELEEDAWDYLTGNGAAFLAEANGPERKYLMHVLRNEDFRAYIGDLRGKDGPPPPSFLHAAAAPSGDDDES